jgi:uncharacterized protein YgiM (DUF1202 family)
MKMKFWLMAFGAIVSTSLLAQPTTPATPTAPATDMPAPVPAPLDATPTITTNTAPAHPTTVKKSTKKKVAHKAVKKPAKPLAELRTVPLVAGPATVVANHVNVRTKPSMVGEVVMRMTNGEPVTVIEEITLKHSGPDEPSAWAKIALPSRSAAWVNAKFIDSTNKTVNVKKLNIRGGPGENYGIIGTLQRGDTINEIITQGEWTKIEAPSTGYAFMAAQYLGQQPAEMPMTAPEMTATNAEPMPAPTPVVEAPAVTPGTNDMASPVTTNEIPVITPTPTPEVTPTNAAPEELTAPRVVVHEGLVRGTVSIQAPTPYELIAPDTHEIVNYLFSTSKELDLSRYKGLRIIVTGEESLDQRWPHTPLITIQKIQVVE